MRKVQPYVAVGAQVTGAQLQPSIVTSAPPLDTRRVRGTNALAGLIEFGSKHYITPVEQPWAGQGLSSNVFPAYQPSKVAPNLIATAKLVALNYMSPIAHRSVLTDILPAPAELPLTKFTNQNRGHRGTGGNFTIPSPLTVTYWPTSMTWLQTRGMVR